MKRVMFGNIKLPAKIEHLDGILQFVKDCARDEGFSRQRISNIELATEEALANVCRYAYSGDCGDIEIRCRTDDDRRLIIDIVDAGKPFNMLTLAEPDLTADISKRELGGLGVLLIRKMVDGIQYSRKDNKNILTFILSNREKRDMSHS